MSDHSVTSSLKRIVNVGISRCLSRQEIIIGGMLREHLCSRCKSLMEWVSLHLKKVQTFSRNELRLVWLSLVHEGRVHGFAMRHHRVYRIRLVRTLLGKFLSPGWSEGVSPAVGFVMTKGLPAL